MSSTGSSGGPRSRPGGSDSDNHTTSTIQKPGRTSSRQTNTHDDPGLPEMRERDRGPSSITAPALSYRNEHREAKGPNYQKGEMKHGSASTLYSDAGGGSQSRDRDRDDRDRDHHRGHRSDRHDRQNTHAEKPLPETAIAPQRSHSTREHERPIRRDRSVEDRKRRAKDDQNLSGSFVDLHATRGEYAEQGRRPQEVDRSTQPDPSRSDTPRVSTTTQAPLQPLEAGEQRLRRSPRYTQPGKAPAPPKITKEEEPDLRGSSDSEDSDMVFVSDPNTPQQSQEVQDRELAIQLQNEAMEGIEYPRSESSSEDEYGDEDGPTEGGPRRDPQQPPSAGRSGMAKMIGNLADSIVGGGGSGGQDRYRERYKDLQTEMIQLRHHYRLQAAQYRDTSDRLGFMEMNFNSARRHIDHLQEELKGTRLELQTNKQQLSDAVNLSEVRGKELKGAQVFLTKADTLSTSDVVQKVGTLNEEIFQAAALLGEMLEWQIFDEGVDRTAVRQQAIVESQERAVAILGAALVPILADVSLKPPQDARPHPLLVQIVIQSALSRWCYETSTAWKPGDRSTSGIIEALYEEIRSTEDQAVAGRWRSLARAHLHYSTSEWTKQISTSIKCVMDIAGWTALAEGIEQFEKRLGSIFKALQDLRKATGEDVTSSDLEVHTVDAGVTFDPRFMEDAYGDERSSSGKGKQAPAPERVYATSGLGLRKVVFKRMSSAGPRGGGNGGGPGPLQRQWELLSMPKVVLEKTIQEALEPPAPTKGRRRKGGDGTPGSGTGGGVLSFIPGMGSG